MRRVIVALLALSLPLGCALHRPATPTQTHLGPVATFGRGIVESEPGWVKFDLDTAAYIILVRITDPSSVYRFGSYFELDCLWRPTPRFRELMRPRCGANLVRLTEPRVAHTRRYGPGTHTVRDYGRYYATGYRVLIASDRRLSVSELLNARVAPEEGDTSLVYLANRLPGALMANRTQRWVAYIAPFGNEDAQVVARGSQAR